MTDYDLFLDSKRHSENLYGFEPTFMPDCLFDFQRSLVEWATRKGRAAVFADCGLGKTFIQLTWAENVARKTGGRVLVLTPMAVSFQTVMEGAKIGVEVVHRREGIAPGDRIVVTNYERLHYFKPEDFTGVVCDESSILKNFTGATKDAITKFMRGHEYRLLCTATAAPNDYIELGTSSEALGELERKHMLAQFFTHDGGDTSSWVLKGHARARLFWEWMTTWAMAVRRPSDLGFEDGAFVLPELKTRQHVVNGTVPKDGYLFNMAAVGLLEQRSDLRKTINERCEMAAQLINAHDRPAVAWCNLNAEGNLLARLIHGAMEVAGSDDDKHKEDVFSAFIRGDIRVLVTKPTIGGFGLNLQHSAHHTFFPSHSYEQFYQCSRRSWRFGQKRPVTIDIITTDGQENVLANMQRKDAQASAMFDNLISAMRATRKRNAIRNKKTQKETIPSWL